MSILDYLIITLIVVVFFSVVIIQALVKKNKELKKQRDDANDNYCRVYQEYCVLKQLREQEKEVNAKTKETVDNIRSGSSSDAADKLRKPSAGRKKKTTSSTDKS